MSPNAHWNYKCSFFITVTFPTLVGIILFFVIFILLKAKVLIA